MRQLLLAALLAVALPAAAQDRPPLARRTLADLAYVLGQTHGLAQVCDPANQTWRSRMIRLVELERPEPGFRAQLFSGFNAGYAGAQAAHPRCGGRSRAAYAQAVARGRDLSRVLAAAR
jgi:uncharacterized protein (TIGR02301 family)